MPREHTEMLAIQREKQQGRDKRRRRGGGAITSEARRLVHFVRERKERRGWRCGVGSLYQIESERVNEGQRASRAGTSRD